MLQRARSPGTTPAVLGTPGLDRPGSRSSVGTYVNFLVACTVLASAALSGVLVAFGGKHREKASAPAPEAEPAAKEPLGAGEKP